jgi:serine/threonine protein kinase
MAATRQKLWLDLPFVRTPQQQLVLPQFVRRGDPFDEDKYVDIDEVGCGAFGCVYQGQSRSDGKLIAIKVLNAGPHQTAEILKALNEAEIGIQINHPNILPIDEVWYDGTRFFFVMDLVMPITPSSLPQSLKEKLVLFQQLVSAVAHLYSQGILHRDIKHQNTGIKLGKDGKPELVLFDFGEAYKVSDHSSEFVGTVLHMAPEVLKSSEYSDKSEIWALMSFLIEILTGKVMILHFFLAGNASIVAVQSKIDSLTEPPIPAVFKTDKSRSGLLLLQILRRGLAIAPKERLTLPELEALLLELLTIL